MSQTLDYWRAHYASRVEALGETDFYRQIGKTVNGQPVGEAMLDCYVAHIVATLGLDGSSRIADLGCGNGLVTARLARHVAEVWGLDYTASLLDVARAHHQPPNVRYDQADLTDWTPQSSVPFASSIEMVQHLGPRQLPGFAAMLGRLLEAGGRALLCGIPDRRRRATYYDTEEKRAFADEMDARGTPHMGHWYAPHELAPVLAEAGLACEEVAQPAALYTHYYRYDLLVERR